MRAYHPSTQRRQHEVSQRYGTANEPPPSLGRKGLGSPTTLHGGAQQAKLPKIGEKLQLDGEKEVNQGNRGVEKREATMVNGDERSGVLKNTVLDSDEATPISATDDRTQSGEETPMDFVLRTLPEQSQDQEEVRDQIDTEAQKEKQFDEHSPPIKAPHLDPPPYVHHFDTYGLVQSLLEGGWDQKQAISVMKSMRMMLADNTILAQEALVSKSNLENEAYLFKAACAELKTGTTTRRRNEQEKMRTGRTQLQHEVDILSQRLGQDTATLKDELKGMFDDRKMAVRNEQRDMESKIQQLNYRITVSLQADAKSEVEGLRMIMTRRVILTLGLVMFMVVGSLKLHSDAKSEMDEAEKRRSRMVSGGTQTFEYTNETPDLAKDGKAGVGHEVIIRESDANPSFVSLG